MKTTVLIIERELGEFTLKLADRLTESSDLKIIAVLSDSRVEESNWWKGVPIHRLCREKALTCLKSEDPDASSSELIERFPRPDFVFTVLNNRFRSRKFLDWPRLGAWSYHGALLPFYQGNNCTAFALLNGEREFGGTIYQPTELVDQGPIVATRSFPIPQGCTNRELYRLGVRNGQQMISDFFQRLMGPGLEKPTNFDVSKAHYYDVLPDREVKLTDDPEKLDRWVRAFYFPPFEPAYIRSRGKKIFLLPERAKLKERLP